MTAADLRRIVREEPDVLTLTELCARWKTTRKTLLAKIHAGELHAFKVGERAYRVAMREVMRYEAA
jgi:excisionase family DNA binding protein